MVLVTPVVKGDLGALKHVHDMCVDRRNLDRLDRASWPEPSLICDGGCVACAVQDANYDQLAIGGQVIDGVGGMEDHAQAWAELLAPGPYEGRVQQRREFCLDGFEKARGDGLRRFGGDVSPDFGEIALGRLGQSEDERVANSFLPRSTIFFVSKSLTRPAATSARPLSMSDLRAVSS